MDYLAVRIAILLWLVRPQDWLSGFGGFQFMQYAMFLAIVGVYKRPQGFHFKLLLQSPADWLVISYLAWIVYTTGDLFGTSRALIPFAAFYFCTALALSTIKKLSGFISCWVAGLGIAAIFALSTHYGFELAPGSADLTSSLGGRLALNTWIFNNPNGLGHGVVALIPLAYVWLIWRRSPGVQLLGLLVIMLAAQTVYLTESKGAYLCGAAALTVTWLFRKPKILQASILLVVLTAGITAIKLLPRMENLSTQEEGIAGRLVIWQMAYNAMHNTVKGEGWKQFEAWVDTEEYGLFKKATHGSYANVGADLGYAGLFLFVGIMYAGARTLYQSTPDPDEDIETVRCQRALLSLLSSFAASAWILDRAYHTDYFILAGAIAAFHRLMTLRSSEEVEEMQTMSEEAPNTLLTTAGAVSWMPSMLPQATLAGHSPLIAFERQPNLCPEHSAIIKNVSEQSSINGFSPLLAWRRLTLMDFVFMTGALYAVLFLWDRMMTNFITL